MAGKQTRGCGCLNLNAAKNRKNMEVRENELYRGRTRVVWKWYTVAEKYPHMCIAKDAKGSRRGLSMGDLIVNGVIKQEAGFEALRKETRTGAFRKGEKQ